MPPGVEENGSGSVNHEEDGSWVDGLLLQELLEGATILNIDVQKATGKGDNYLSVIYRTRVQYRVPGSEEVLVKHLMVKSLPPGEFIQKYIEELNIFRRETTVYSDVLPKLYAFAASRLGERAFKSFSAGFYKTSRPDTLILEDLKPRGFVMASRRERLDFAHSKLVVQNLARLHAISLAYMQKYPDSFSDFEDHMFSESNRGRLVQFIPSMLRKISEEVRNWEGFTEIANKLQQQQDIFVDKIIDVCKPKDILRRVLLHGDCWVNNIMFKYSEAGEVVDLRFVDYQLTRKASPALDLQYFIFSSLRGGVRQHHYDDLLREYCDEFGRWIKDLGHGELAVSFKAIHMEMERTATFGFAAAMSTMAAVLTEPEDMIDFEDIPEDKVDGGEIDFFNKAYQNPRFREAFEEILPYFDKRGVFN